MPNPIRQKEIDERIGKAADSFWGAFQMTENGKVKSTLLLYSFCLCWVFLLVYCGCMSLFSRPLDALLAGRLPVALVNVIEVLAVAVPGTAVCCLTWLLPGDKRLLPAAYAWLTLLMLASLVTLMILMGLESAGLILQFFGLFVLGPLLVGDGAAALLYYQYWKKRPPVVDPARPWKRQ